jgi:lipopolysaccharide/colanic/teichoic acid biosynthesis glycosyltransferase
MAHYGNMRRRWVAAFSSNGLFGGMGLTAEPSRQWSTARGLEWTVSRVPSGSVRSSAARVTSAIPQMPIALAIPSVAGIERRLVIDEEIFRGVLVREQKRADRFGEPFVLLLVGLPDLNPADAAATWHQTASIVVAATRETDVIGWVTGGRVLGVVLTEIGESEEAVARDIEARISRDLADKVDRASVSGLSVRLHFNVRSKTTAAEALWPADPLLFKLSADEDRRSVRDGLKRALDILGSAALLLLLSPVFLAIGLLVKLKSPGPVFFRQVRVGQKAKPFTMLKFRSMNANADSKVHQQYVTEFIKSGGQSADTGTNQVFKLTSDPRITPLGHILRKTSLDELPQLWNVLRGDMSLVGPRPPLFYETEQYQPWHWRRVLDAKPGVTGLWQVAGRSRTTFDGMVRLDLRYVKNRSLWTDIKILLATPAAVFTGKGAC